MKKILFCMIGAALVAGCSKNETKDLNPQNPDVSESVYVELSASAGNDSRATYDYSLHAYWESGDQILGVQGFACGWAANGNKQTINANTLDLLSGDNTAIANFGGNIGTQRNAATYFHFAYPASRANLSTYGEVGAWDFSVSSSTQTTTCTFTVPAEQDGKWTPFLCASTAEKVTVANIRDVDFGKSRNAAFGIRVFEIDKTTPKKLAYIEIVAANNIVGTLSKTTANDGSFDGLTFDVNATGNTITATNPQYTEGVDGNGRTYYEYRFEVLPVESGAIKLTLVADDGSQVERVASTKAFKANKRSGVNVIWDAAQVAMDSPTSWYEDSDASAVSSLKENTLYVNNIKVSGVAASRIQEIGVYVKVPGATDFYKVSLGQGVLQIDSDYIAANGGSGVYTVYPYTKIEGVADEIVGGEQEVIVTNELSIASHTIRSSYNSNDKVAKTNDFAGDKIGATVSLNDVYAQANLVSSVTLHYGSATANGNAGSEFTTSSLGWQAYNNCYVEVVMKNGLTYRTNAYTINVTGLPLVIDRFSSVPSGWSQSNTSTYQDCVCLKPNTANVTTPAFFIPSTFGVTAAISAYAYSGIRGNNRNVYIYESTASKGSATALEYSGYFPNQAKFSNVNRDINLNVGSKSICIYAEGDNKGVGGIDKGVYIKSVSIKYN